MGEYAIKQMERDFERLTGVKPDAGDLERARRIPPKNKCHLCGKRLLSPCELCNRLKDKHGRS